MSEIKIFVTHTPDSSDLCVEQPAFCHVAAGSCFWKEALPKNMEPDNTGENISQKNRAYCELTTQYWAWKNVKADYYGFCHYRRYFSFAQKKYKEADCGCLSYPYLNKEMEQALCMDEESIRRKVEQYDLLIAAGIPVRMLGADTVYGHYKNAPELNIKDLELFVQILCRKYPHLRRAARSYINGRIFYPCNMFIMKKELFFEYSKMLFTALEEFERRADMRFYSIEGRRTPGHLGERFAGIYYEYLKQKGGCRLCELQAAVFGHTKKEADIKLRPHEIPIVLSADQNYVPILYTCIKSLVDCADASRSYHIFVFHTDICTKDMQVFKSGLECSFIYIDFVDVGAGAAGWHLKAKQHITVETYYRFLILELLKNCPKVIYLDSDLIIRRDVARLYDLPMDSCLLAAALDPDFIGQYNGANTDTRRYCKEVLRLKNPYQYAQAGVLIFHTALLRQKTSVRRLFRMAETGDYKYSDQDILNIVCEGRIKKLDMAWNVLAGSRRHKVVKSAPAGIQKEYEQARKEPYIIHYAGDSKPWQHPEEDFAQEFWKTARQTPYYEQLLYGMCVQEKNSSYRKKAVVLLKRTVKKVLPSGSRIRRAAVSIYWKMR